MLLSARSLSSVAADWNNRSGGRWQRMPSNRAVARMRYMRPTAYRCLVRPGRSYTACNDGAFTFRKGEAALKPELVAGRAGLAGPANGQSANLQGWLSDTNRHGLSGFTTGANAVIHRHVVADH